MDDSGLSVRKKTLPLELFLVMACAWSPGHASEVPLPTPMDHYGSYDVATETRALFSSILADSPEAARLLSLLTELRGNPEPAKQEALVELLQSLGWSKWRPRLSELLLHQSQVLELLSPGFEKWHPVVHDSLLFFLDRLTEERLLRRVVGQMSLPAETARGSRTIHLLTRTPTLQKLGQILARHPRVPEDFRHSLQTLENEISTVGRAELIDSIVAELGAETLDRLQMEFAEGLLAEASVGAVIEARLVLPGDSEPRRAVCKVIKPYAVAALEEELEIFAALSRYFTEQRDFYQIGDVPLSETFEEIREALSREVMVSQEQANLRRARTYYRGNGRIAVPEIYPASTETVTCMEFMEGVKISDAFPEDPRARRVMARRLSDALTFDVLFANGEETLFHGDPHAGNVFHSPRPHDPYRIALLDWGLAGRFTREERKGLVQLLVGARLRDRKRLQRHAGVLIEGGAPDLVDAQRGIHLAVEDVLSQQPGEGAFDLLQKLIVALTQRGFQIPLNLVLFVKSQLTIEGILLQLDPDLKHDECLMRRVSGQVFKELPKRLAYTLSVVGWNSRGYRSLLSNEDVKDIQIRKAGRGLKKAFVGLAGLFGRKPRPSPRRTANGG